MTMYSQHVADAFVMCFARSVSDWRLAVPSSTLRSKSSRSSWRRGWRGGVGR